MSRILDFWKGMTGTVLDFAGTAPPPGWLLCFGQSLLRTDYPALFGVVGTTYGAVDATHFTLPDCRGRAAVGKDNMGGAAASRLTTAAGGVDGATLGAAGGGEAHALTAAQMPLHNHGVTDPGHNHTISDPGHTHGHNAQSTATQGSSGVGGSVIFSQYGGATISAAGTGISVVAKVTGITTQNAGTGNSHPNVQPSIVLNKIIKA
ncbi:Phage Tail Collar Domain protein [compost metagenome]